MTTSQTRAVWRAALPLLALLIASAGVARLAWADDPPKTIEDEGGEDEGGEDGEEGGEGGEDGEEPTGPPPPPPLTPAQIKASQDAFVQVAKVLQSPRCMNCHPSGDRPLQTDASTPHAMNISRKSVKAGLECATCHQTKNSEAYGLTGGPPGAPNWHLPPEDTPMVFQGLTPAQLCAQLKDPKQNGGKDLDGLLEHVSHDPLVLWGWDPGGTRTKPPLDHATFVRHFKTWVQWRGTCPE